MLSQVVLQTYLKIENRKDEAVTPSSYIITLHLR